MYDAENILQFTFRDRKFGKGLNNEDCRCNINENTAGSNKGDPLIETLTETIKNTGGIGRL